jgi:hypothetical protein
MATGVWLGLAGAMVGVASATLAWRLEVRRRRAVGELATARAILFGSRLGVERAAMSQAAAVTLPAYVLVVAVAAAVELGSAAAGVITGLAGFMYGTTCAVASRRLGR